MGHDGESTSLDALRASWFAGCTRIYAMEPKRPRTKTLEGVWTYQTLAVARW
jgi:hypothetical protein